MKEAAYWIDQLELRTHPEGGFYRELYRATETVAPAGLPERYAGSRNFGTAIYFLLRTEDYSAFHRLLSDEHWHFHTGSAAVIHIIGPDRQYEAQHIGPDLDAGQQFLVTIPANSWFAAEVTAPNSYILVSCTVSPGFDFADFELAQQAALLASHPEHANLIKRFTKP